MPQSASLALTALGIISYVHVLSDEERELVRLRQEKDECLKELDSLFKRYDPDIETESYQRGFCIRVGQEKEKLALLERQIAEKEEIRRLSDLAKEALRS